MLSLLCDRCKKVLDNPPKRFNYFKITRQGNPIDGINEVDLCDACYAEFAKWIEEGKENEE